MFRFRPRLSFANVVAALALFIALGGGALAATAFVGPDGRIHGCVDSKGHLILVKAAKTCGKGKHAIAWNEKGRRGPRGLRGQHGAKGDKGAACLSSDPACVGPKGDACLSSDPTCVGPKGDTGPSGASALLGRINGIPANLASVKFGAPSGTTTASDFDSRVHQLAPNAPFTAKDLDAHFQTSADPGSDQDATGMRVVLSDDTSGHEIDCNVVSGSTCNSGSSTLSVAAGDELAVFVIAPPGTTPPSVATDVLFGWRAATP